MNKRRIVRFVFRLSALLVLATVAYAGGWATITLNDFPDYATAGKPLPLTFMVRQHGVSPLSGLQPAITAAKAGGLSVKASARPGRTPGEYTAAVVLPEPGDWTITIASGFNDNGMKLPALRVVAAGAADPSPFSPVTRGLRLFTAKGCVSCHRHLEANPERSTDAPLDLTTRRFNTDYLKKFLADPSVKTEDMPKLNLKAEEIDALAAFINKNKDVKKQIPN